MHAGAPVTPRSNRVRPQSVRERRTIGSLPAQTFRGAHCEPAAVPTRDEYGHAQHGRAAQEGQCSGHFLALPGPLCAGGGADGCRRVGESCDSSPARGAEQNQPSPDGAGRSPGAALPLPRHSIGIARVMDRGGNCEYWLHTPRAGCHRLLGVAHGQKAADWQDSAACHQAGA